MSDFLFANPSFLSGVARTMDIGGVFDDYNSSETTELADRTAILADLVVVANAMKAEVARAKSSN